MKLYSRACRADAAPADFFARAKRVRSARGAASGAQPRHHEFNALTLHASSSSRRGSPSGMMAVRALSLP